MSWEVDELRLIAGEPDTAEPDTAVGPSPGPTLAGEFDQVDQVLVEPRSVDRDERASDARPADAEVTLIERPRSGLRPLLAACLLVALVATGAAWVNFGAWAGGGGPANVPPPGIDVRHQASTGGAVAEAVPDLTATRDGSSVAGEVDPGAEPMPGAEVPAIPDAPIAPAYPAADASIEARSEASNGVEAGPGPDAIRAPDAVRAGPTRPPPRRVDDPTRLRRAGGGRQPDRGKTQGSQRGTEHRAREDP